MINILYKIISEIIKIFGRLYLYIYILFTYITLIKKNKQWIWEGIRMGPPENEWLERATLIGLAGRKGIGSRM